MAVQKHILKLTEREAVIKVGGTSGTATINLSSDLVSDKEVAREEQNVSIKQISWCGLPESTIVISRNSVKVASISASSANTLNFNAGFTESVESQSNITVTVSGEAQCWITLGKISGYSSKIEPAHFGSYDNVNEVGN